MHKATSGHMTWNYHMTYTNQEDQDYVINDIIFTLKESIRFTDFDGEGNYRQVTAKHVGDGRYVSDSGILLYDGLISKVDENIYCWSGIFIKSGYTGNFSLIWN